MIPFLFVFLNKKFHQWKCWPVAFHSLEQFTNKWTQFFERNVNFVTIFFTIYGLQIVIAVWINALISVYIAVQYQSFTRALRSYVRHTNCIISSNVDYFPYISWYWSKLSEQLPEFTDKLKIMTYKVHLANNWTVAHVCIYWSINQYLMNTENENIRLQWTIQKCTM